MSRVACRWCTKSRMHFTIWKVLLLSRPVEICKQGGEAVRGAREVPPTAGTTCCRMTGWRREGFQQRMHHHNQMD